MKLESPNRVMVPLQVVLGATAWPLQDVAAMGEGTIIELDRLAGEPVDLMAAGELIARGEVVVIDESFGIRLTEIVSAQEGVEEL